MIVQLTLKEGGLWRSVDVLNTDVLKEILNTGQYLGQQVYAVMIFYGNAPMIYDFILRRWR